MHASKSSVIYITFYMHIHKNIVSVYTNFIYIKAQFIRVAAVV